MPRQMLRLIGVFAGRTGHFVCFVTLRFLYVQDYFKCAINDGKTEIILEHPYCSHRQAVVSCRTFEMLTTALRSLVESYSMKS